MIAIKCVFERKNSMIISTIMINPIIIKMIPEIISFCNIIKLMPYMGIDNDNVKYNSDFIYSNMQFKIDIIHIVSIKNLAILYFAIASNPL
ncbi:MAG TPA: hypothetical protein VIK94_01970 [Bacilli bacterium]